MGGCAASGPPVSVRRPVSSAAQRTVPTAGCSVNSCTLGQCGGTSCWVPECTAPGACFTTYRRQEGGLPSLVRLYHWNEAGTVRNRYTTSPSAPVGYIAASPPDLGLIATTPVAPPGLAALPLLECQWTPGIGGVDYFLVTGPDSGCSGAGFTITARLGYVWTP